MRLGLAEGSLEKNDDHLPCLWGADPTSHRPSEPKDSLLQADVKA